MSERQRREKDEKSEKQDEKEEKNREEKFQRDPVGVLTWAVILIWVAGVLLAENFGWAPVLSGYSIWAIILAGAGVIVLLQVLVRLFLPEYRRPIVGNLILGFILLGVGLGDLFGWNIVLPLVLLAIALILVTRTITAHRTRK